MIIFLSNMSVSVREKVRAFSLQTRRYMYTFLFNLSYIWFFLFIFVLSSFTYFLYILYILHIVQLPLFFYQIEISSLFSLFFSRPHDMFLSLSLSFMLPSQSSNYLLNL